MAGFDVRQPVLASIPSGTYADAALAAYAPESVDAVVYVSKGSAANDSNTGLSPGKAKATIAAAVAALPAAGGVVQMLCGDFAPGATVGIARDRVVFKGVGYGLTRWIAPDVDLALDVGDNVSIYREFRCEGITFYRPTPGGAGLVRIRKMDQWRIDDCGFAGGTVNIEVHNGIAGVISRCGINSYTQSGLAIDNSDQVIVSKNTWETNFGGIHHVKVNSSNKALNITNNVFSTATYAVFADGAPSDDCGLVGNTVENCPNGFLIGGLTNPSSSRWAIVGNVLRGTSTASTVGIRLYGTGHTVAGNTVTQYASAIDEAGGAAGSNLVVGNKTDLDVTLGATSTSALNRNGGIGLSSSANFQTLGGLYFGTVSASPAAGAVKVSPLYAAGRTKIEVGNGSAWQTVIEFLDTRRMAFFGASPVSQPAALADTSGATLAALETEVNTIKAKLRALGLMAT